MRKRCLFTASSDFGNLLGETPDRYVMKGRAGKNPTVADCRISIVTPGQAERRYSEGDRGTSSPVLSFEAEAQVVCNFPRCPCTYIAAGCWKIDRAWFDSCRDIVSPP